jgi:MoxR-like ATPase
LGYPHPRAEREMFERRHSAALEIKNPRQCINMEQLDTIRVAVSKVHASDHLLDYLQRLVAYTRQSAEFEVGLSPRGALALLDSAKTWAVMNNRSHVVPEDVQFVLPAVAAHRLLPSGDYAGDSNALVDLLQRNVDVIGP